MTPAEMAVGRDRGIDEAVEVDHAALVGRFGDLPGAGLRRGEREQELRTGLASGFFNNVISIRWEEVDGERLDGIVGRARQRGAPWRCYLTAATTPDDLEAALAAAGLRRGISGRCMLLDDPTSLVRPSVDGLHIEQVIDVDGLDRWLGVRVRTNDWGAETTDAWRVAHAHLGFSATAPVRYWFASLDCEPVATVLLHLGDPRPDGVRDAGIYHVETVPSARRRGIATKLTAHAIEAAAHLGASRIVLSATDAARSSYARLGFRPGGPFTYWFDPDLGA